MMRFRTESLQKHCERSVTNDGRRNEPESLLRHGLTVLIPERHVQAEEIRRLGDLFVAREVAESLFLALLDDAVRKVVEDLRSVLHLASLSAESLGDSPEGAAKARVSAETSDGDRNAHLLKRRAICPCA